MAVVIWSPTDKAASAVLSNGNLTAALAAVTAAGAGVRATLGQATGKWYWEYTVVTVSATDTEVGLVTLDYGVTTGTGGAGAVIVSNGGVFSSGTNPGSIGALVNGDIITVAYDGDARTLTFTRNGGSPVTATTIPVGALYPFCGTVSGGGTTNTVTANFGASAFTYSVPAGYSALGTGPAIIASAAPATAVLTGSFINYGVVRGALKPPSASLAGIQTAIATIIAAWPKPTVALVGGPQAITASFPLPTAVLSAFSGVAGVIAASAAVPSSTFVGAATALGTIAAQAPAPTATLTAARGSIATIAASAPRASSKLYGAVTISGTISAVAAVPTTAFAGGFGFVVTIAAEAPLPRAYMTTDQAVDTLVRTIVAHSITAAVTEYESYGYDSFAVINGTVYGAGADGIYELDSSGTDNGTPIDAHFELGAMDFKSEYLKRFESLYAAYRTTGDIHVVVRTDEGKSYTYVMKWDKVSAIKQRRVPVGKGLKGKYWQLRFENVNGSGFGFDTFNALAHETVRRIGV